MIEIETGAEDEEESVRNHSASFKAKVAVAAIRGDKTLAELSEQFDVHQNQIQDWRRKLLDHADQVFGRGGSFTVRVRTQGQGTACQDREN